MILGKVGATVEKLYQSLPSVAADEQITQEQSGYDDRMKWTTQHHFSYLIIVDHDAPVEVLREYRTDAQMRVVESTGVGQGFNFTQGFASMWLLFYPANQSQTRFRYLGQQASPGGNQYVLAFAERSPEAPVTGRVNRAGESAVLLYQGVAWVDAVTFRIERMRLDLLEPQLDVGLERTTTEIQFGEVQLAQTVLWLPREVTVTTIYEGQLYRNLHLYSNFRRFVVHSEIKPVELTQPHPPN